MRALQCEQYGPPENVRVVNCSEPGDPGPGNVIIRVRYASVSHAVGLMVAGRYQTRPSLPFVPGTEAVGHVISVGSEVRGLEPGMAVLVVNNWGCYAETICVPDSTVYPIPDGVDLLQALPLAISYGTAFTGLVWRCAIQPGDNVLVLGAGAGVGLAAVELASLLGATVIACASTEEKRAAALDRGASFAIAPGEDLARNVKQHTQGQGADIVVDPVGGELSGYAVQAAAANGQILSIGFASGTLPAVAANYLLVKNLTWHGFFYGRYIGWTPADERAVHAPAMKRAMATLMHWTQTGKIHPTIERVYALEELPQALHALHSRQVIGKLALSISQETTP